MESPARLSTGRKACQRVIAALAASSAILAASQPATSSRLAFIDIAAEAGVTFTHRASPTTEKYLLEAMGSGVAIFDADNDGRLDLYFVNGAALRDPMPAGALPAKSDATFHNRLYRQTGGGRFEDVTARAGVAGHGYGTGTTVGDYDNDGDADLFVAAYGGNTLYRNDGRGAFTDVTREAGVTGGGWSASAAFVDVDADGRLDLFVTRYLDWSFAENGSCGERPPGRRAYCHPDRYRGVASLLYHNDGGGRFTEIGEQAGIAASGKALGIAIADVDRDGAIDLFVANDSVPEFLFRNRGGARFEDIALASGAALDEHGQVFAGMGVALEDQDNDGWPDVLVTTLANQMYACFRNERTGRFAYATHRTGLADLTRLSSGWGVALTDFDNDGWRDLLVAQGHVLDTIEHTSPHLRYQEPLLLARRTGARFVEASTGGGDVFTRRVSGRGLATGDLDGDGRVDAVVTTLDGRALVLRNVTAGAGHWLGVRLEGRRSNRDGIGATLEVVSASGATVYATVSTAGSYLSSSDRTAHIGLGPATGVERVIVRWPSGIVQVVAKPPIDRVLTIVEER